MNGPALGSITDVPGVRVGHWSDHAARTGCTVVTFPDGSVASGEVRGGAPATREFELLRPERLVARIDAVVLTGGSAFGLAAADGVADALGAEGIGFATPVAAVPIVVAMALFDLGVGSAAVRPGAAQGAAALTDARGTDGTTARHGRIGAATGATVGKWWGPDHRRPGALVGASARAGDVVVGCLVAVNAWGDIDDGLVRPWPPASVVAPAPASAPAPGPEAGPGPLEHTTIGVIATNAVLDKVGCLLVAQGGHDGLARALSPAHARADGDALVAVSVAAPDGTARPDAPVDAVRLLATRVVEAAVRATALVASWGAPEGDR